MKTNTTPLENHQVKLTVEFDQPELEKAKRQAANKIARQLKIPGFRPGKAPYQVVLRHVGEEEIRKEAIEILAEEQYPKAIKEADILPYGPATLEKIEDSESGAIILDFRIPLEAITTLGSYHEVRVPYEIESISDQDIENTLNGLRDNQAIIEPVDRPAQEGDMLQVLIKGTKIQSEPDDETSLITERSIPVTIEKEDADTSDEWPLPGFSRQLINLSANEEKTLIYKYPDDSPFESLRGVDAEFHLKVERVSSRRLPELNDEFAKSIEDFDSLEELRKEIRINLEKRNQDMYDQTYDKKIIDIILETSTVEYPPQMIDDETENMIGRLQSRLSQQRLDLDTYLKMRKVSLEELKTEMRSTAEDNIRRSLVLFKIADDEHIEISPKEVQQEAEETITRLSEIMPEDKFKQLSSSKNMKGSLIRNVMVDQLIQKTQKHLRNIAQGLSENNEDAANTDNNETSDEKNDDDKPNDNG